LSNTGEWKEVLLHSEWEVDTKFRYKIIIPQEEPKQENCCTPIGQIKRYKDCIGCDRKPKQEQLEESSENKLRTEFETLIKNKTGSNIEFLLESNNTNYISWLENKWQAERMYSEEKVREAFKHGILFKEESVSTCEEAIETEFSMLVEQFKKK
jgi:hypothetical protein